MFKKKLNSTIKIIFFILIVGFFGLFFYFNQQKKETFIQQSFCYDTKEKNCLDQEIIKCGSTQILINGGKAQQFIFKIDQFFDFFDHTIDYFVLSDISYKNLEWILDLIKRGYLIKKVYLSNHIPLKENYLYQYFLKKLITNKISTIVLTDTGEITTECGVLKIKIPFIWGRGNEAMEYEFVKK